MDTRHPLHPSALGGGGIGSRDIRVGPGAPRHPDRGAGSTAGRVGTPLLLGELCLAFLAALMVRLIDLSILPPDPDDLLHLYAARSYLLDGSLSIFTGTYVRAADYTRLVAACLYLFGDSLNAARLPALISGAGLVAAVYAWMRIEVGRGAAVLAAATLALLAPAVEVSTLVRFYALQSLLFWLGAAAIYAALTKDRSWGATAALVAFGLITWVEAARLQVISAVGIAGFLAWAALFLTWRLRRTFPVRTLAIAWAGLLLAAGLVLLGLIQAGIAAKLYGMYRETAFWATPDRDYYQYYYHEMSKIFGLLMDLLPLAGLLALLWFPRPAIYCGTVFITGFLLHSFAGMKGARYIFYLLPFFTCIWAMAAWAVTLTIRDRVLAAAGTRAWLSPFVVTAAVGCFLALIVIKAVPVLEGTARSIAQPGYHRHVDSRDQAWLVTRDMLRPIVMKSEVFVSDDDLLADFHVGRADLVLNKSRLLENNPADEFTRDFRTGTPTISDEASIRTVLSCFGSGVILTYEPFLDWLSPESRTLLAENTRRLDLARDFVGFVWDTPRDAGGTNCERVRGLVLETAAQRRGAP